MTSEEHLSGRFHPHDADTRELLSVVDRHALLVALEAAIEVAEEDMTDLIAEDYDDDIDFAGEDVIDWELGALREVEGRLRAACSVAVALYRDEDADLRTTAGQCWCLIEFAERPWRGASLTASKHRTLIERAGPVPWTSL